VFIMAADADNTKPEILSPEDPERDIFLFMFPELAALAVISKSIDDLLDPAGKEDRHG